MGGGGSVPGGDAVELGGSTLGGSTLGGATLGGATLEGSTAGLGGAIVELDGAMVELAGGVTTSEEGEDEGAPASSGADMLELVPGSASISNFSGRYQRHARAQTKIHSRTATAVIVATMARRRCSLKRKTIAGFIDMALRVLKS